MADLNTHGDAREEPNKGALAAAMLVAAGNLNQAAGAVQAAETAFALVDGAPALSGNSGMPSGRVAARLRLHQAKLAELDCIDAMRMATDRMQAVISHRISPKRSLEECKDDAPVSKRLKFGPGTADSESVVCVSGETGVDDSAFPVVPQDPVEAARELLWDAAELEQKYRNTCVFLTEMPFSSPLTEDLLYRTQQLLHFAVVFRDDADRNFEDVVRQCDEVHAASGGGAEVEVPVPVADAFDEKESMPDVDSMNPAAQLLVEAGLALSLMHDAAEKEVELQHVLVRSQKQEMLASQVPGAAGLDVHHPGVGYGDACVRLQDARHHLETVQGWCSHNASALLELMQRQTGAFDRI